MTALASRIVSHFPSVPITREVPGLCPEAGCGELDDLGCDFGGRPLCVGGEGVDVGEDGVQGDRERRGVAAGLGEDEPALDGGEQGESELVGVGFGAECATVAHGEVGLLVLEHGLGLAGDDGPHERALVGEVVV